MYDRVLFPTDGSEAAADAADHAYSHAERYEATLHVLYVVEEAERTGIVAVDEATDGVPDAAESAVEAVAEPARERGIAVETAVRDGTPHREILDYAEAVDADLVVMRTHGRSGVGRWLSGSVTERVLRDTTRPVLALNRG